MEVKQKLAAEPAIEGIPNRSRIAPFNNKDYIIVGSCRRRWKAHHRSESCLCGTSREEIVRGLDVVYCEIRILFQIWFHASIPISDDGRQSHWIRGFQTLSLKALAGWVTSIRILRIFRLKFPAEASSFQFATGDRKIYCECRAYIRWTRTRHRRSCHLHLDLDVSTHGEAASVGESHVPWLALEIVHQS